LSETDDPKANSGEIMRKIKEEVVDRKQQATQRESCSEDASLESDRIIWMIEQFADIVANKSQRTILPKAFNRFPIDRLSFLSRWILRSYDYVFKDQREANCAMISMIQTLAREAVNLQSQIADLKHSLLEQQHRLVLMSEGARERLPDDAIERQVDFSTKQKDHNFDLMYVLFEDRFRGTREDIKERQRKYLPYLAETITATDRDPMLDLGCGRGEWLDLLKENGYLAQGVDTNRFMIESCRQRDLEVVEADVIEFLRQQKSETVGAVTSFHLIEHLSFESLISLLDECLRVLRPGGIIILESPNPENIQVGACNFYVDPTHRRPIPPVTAAFLVEIRGFVQAEILRMHPSDGTCQATPSDDLLTTRFNQLFCGPRDYAVIGRKVQG
jgi:SAM-dependent methyltransferase